MPNQVEHFRQLCAAACYQDTNQLHTTDRSYLGTIPTSITIDTSTATTMWPFLAVPLEMRLVLLCNLEGATMQEVKAVLPYAKETDVRQTSHRMRAAIETFNQAMEDPTAWLHPGPYPEDEAGDLSDHETPFPLPDRLIPRDTDIQLRQVFFPEAAILLFGELVPEQIADLGLQARLILYTLSVCELEWGEVERLLGCSEWRIRQALKQGIEVLGGTPQ